MKRRKNKGKFAAIVSKIVLGYPFVAVLLVVYWVLAVSAVRLKSSTFDEMSHIACGYSCWTTNDYRLTPELGNLTQRWLALPLLFDDYKLPPTTTGAWKRSDFWSLSYRFAYNEGNDPDKILFRARMMNAVLGVALGLTIYLWSRFLFGRTGGLISLSLYAFSPTFLAHGGLATADLSTAWLFLLSAGGMWMVLHRLNWMTLLASSVAVSALFLSKVSSAIFLPVAFVLAVIRLFSRKPWLFDGRFNPLRKTRRSALSESQSNGVKKEKIKNAPEHSGPGFQKKIVGLIGGFLVHVFIVTLLIWMAYGFRYSAFNQENSGQLKYTWEFVLNDTGVVGKAIGIAKDHQLFPEAFLFGFASVVHWAGGRNTFLNGSFSTTGWWYFFPYCFFVKTPLPFLAILLMSVVAVIVKWRCSATNECAPIWQSLKEGTYWTIPLWLIFAIYWFTAIRSNLNIGHRHILPTYPPLFVLAGASAYYISKTHRYASKLIVLLVVVFIFESIRIRPHYLAYFNQLVGGPRNAYRHLVDSSLDWGQDLPLLKEWLDENNKAGEPVYLSYFGTAKPEYYKIRSRRLRSYAASPFRKNDFRPLLPGIYCVSATMLSSIYTRYKVPWSADDETLYQSHLKELTEFYGAGEDIRNRQIIDNGRNYWDEKLNTFDELRFARLCHFLRGREPDDSIGYSILIYRLTADDVKKVQFGDFDQLTN